MNIPVYYINLNEHSKLTDISCYAPFKVVLVIEDEVSDETQSRICKWLVEMGCFYVITRGENAQSWSELVQAENLKKVGLDNMSADQFMMKTSFKYERLKQVFWYAKKVAVHPEISFKSLIIVHLANKIRRVNYLSIYEKA